MTINKLDDMYGKEYPYVYKSTWKLLVDAAETNKEVFTSVQVIFTGSATPTICIEPVEGTAINPIVVPYSGAILPIVGRGFKSSGTDKNGVSYTTAAEIIEVIALGGI